VGRWGHVVRKLSLHAYKRPLIIHVSRPLNTSATAKDIAEAFNVSRPTHVAVYPALLKVVQDAILATDMAKEGRPPKVFTIVERVKGLPKAISPQNIFISMRNP
jgi:hypothetical protein